MVVVLPGSLPLTDPEADSRPRSIHGVWRPFRPCSRSILPRARHARIFFAMSHAEGCHRLALPAPEDAEVLPHVVSHLRQGRLGNGRLKVPQQDLGSIVTAKPRRPLPWMGRSAQFRGKPWATGVPKLDLRGRHVQPGSCFVLAPCSRFPAPAGNPILVLGHGLLDGFERLLSRSNRNESQKNVKRGHWLFSLRSLRVRLWILGIGFTP